jgi:hypothetical protein
VTHLESQLRQELLDIAQQVTVADLRPLRRPPAGHRRKASWLHPARWVAKPGNQGRRWPGAARWLIPLTAGVAVACVATGLWLAGNFVSHGHGPVATWSPVPDPPAFPMITVRLVQHNYTAELQLISPITGRVVRSLGATQQFESGLAMSPDLKSVYLDDAQGEIWRISAVTGKATMVVGGVSPAVSPDGRYLAYLPQPVGTRLAIRDLRTGVTRTIDLAPLTGAKAGLMFEGAQGVAWLGNGKQVVVLPEPDHFTGPAGPKANRCGQQDSPIGLCMIVVNANASKLTASRVYVPGVRPIRNQINVGIGGISGDWASRTTLLISTRPASTPIPLVYAVTIDGDRAIKRWTVALPRHIEQITVAPDGDRILYLLNGRKVQLWIATVRNGRIVAHHRLLVQTTKMLPQQIGW